MHNNFKIVNTGPLSFQQQKAWYLEMINEEKISILNICSYRHIYGDIDMNRLKKALLFLYNKHAALRTIFNMTDGQPYQQILKMTKDILLSTLLEELDISDFESNDPQIILQSLVNKEVDLSKFPIAKFLLLKIKPQEYVLGFNTHHIIGDYDSSKIIWNDLILSYNELFLNDNADVIFDKYQYFNYAIDQKKFCKNVDEWHSMEQYWVSEFLNIPDNLKLSFDYSRPALMKNIGDSYTVNLDDELKQSLKKIAFANRTTISSLFLACYYILLGKYSGQKDIVVGTYFSNRDELKLLNIVGFFSTILPIKIENINTLSFNELIKIVKIKIDNSVQYQKYPLEKLVEKINPNRDLSISPIFQVAFNMLSKSNNKLSFQGTDTDGIEYVDFKISQYDITLNVIDSEENLAISFEYATSLFKKESMMKMSSCFVNILKSIVENPNIAFGKISLFRENEKESFISKGGKALEYINQSETIVEKFEKMVELYPDEIAVKIGMQSITYTELNANANKVAKYLKDLTNGSNYPIGICYKPSISMIIGIIGILKSGGNYVPLDHKFPSERIGYIITDLDIKHVLADDELLKLFSSIDRTPISVESIVELNANCDVVNPHLSEDNERVFYTISTSGSTGKPKGAAIYQRGFKNLINWFIGEFNLSSTDNALIISSISFDLTQKNIFCPILCGGVLNLYDLDFFDPESILNEIKINRVTWINCTPSAFSAILEISKHNNFAELVSLKYVFLGGEPILSDLLIPLIDSTNFTGKLVNTYGPTECTDVCSYFVLTRESLLLKSIPIGKPIYNTSLVVLDEDLMILPEGIEGELGIMGMGVCKGYVNNEKLTNEKFIPNIVKSEDSKLLYRTGDRVKLLNDGNIEFIGRMDSQIKFRGFRIELNEIEYEINQCADIKESVVILRDDSLNNKSLICYVVPTEFSKFSLEAVKAELTKKLPTYMIPSSFYAIEKMPLNKNGKIDRGELNKMVTPRINLNDKNTSIFNSIELETIKIWREVLVHKEIHIEDNFYDIGGHSLLAIQLASKIKKQFKVNIPILKLFSVPKVKEMSQLISEALIN